LELATFRKQLALGLIVACASINSSAHVEKKSDCNITQIGSEKIDPPKIKLDGDRLLHSGPGLNVFSHIRCRPGDDWKVGVVQMVVEHSFVGRYEGGKVIFELTALPILDSDSRVAMPFANVPLEVNSENGTELIFRDDPGGIHPMILKIPDKTGVLLDRRLLGVDRSIRFKTYLVAFSRGQGKFIVLKKYEWKTTFTFNLTVTDFGDLSFVKPQRSFEISEQDLDSDDPLFSIDWIGRARNESYGNSSYRRRWIGASTDSIDSANLPN
jgi:hypothetical protein